MIQKVMKVGNSLAMTIPREFIKTSGVRAGDEIAVETSPTFPYIFVKPKKEDKRISLTPEFKEWLDTFIAEYRPILKKLAHM